METGLASTVREALDPTQEQGGIGLAVLLTAGLCLFVPVFVLLADAVTGGFPFTVLIAVGLVLSGYAAYAVRERSLLTAAVVATVVLSTFNADAPLLADAGQFPGHFGGYVTLAHVALVGTILILAVTRERPLRSWAGILLGVFLLWTILAAVFGSGPSMVTGLLFSQFVGFVVLLFFTVSTVVSRGYVSFRVIVSALTVAAVGHTLVAVAQFVGQAPLGHDLSRLGEGPDGVAATAAVPFVGDVSLGLYVSGFTGMPFHLANLLTLTLPILAVLTLGRRRLLNAVGGVWIIVSLIVLRATTTDAGRGAVIVAALVLAGILLYWRFSRSSRQTSQPFSNRIVQATPTPLLGLLVVLYPSSDAGQTSTTADFRPQNSASSGANSGSDASGSTGGSGTGGGTTDGSPRDIDSLIELLSSTPIPLFDLSNLGNRFKQWVVAFDLTARSPLFGTGGGNYVLMAGQYGIVPPAWSTLPVAIHNAYIAVLAETGVIGLALFLGAVLTVLATGLRFVRGESDDAVLVCAVTAGLIGTLAFNFWGKLLIYNITGAFPFWLLAGALVGFAAAHDSGRSVE